MKFALIGAELCGLDVHTNYQRTSDLRNELVKKGLSFVGVQNISSNKKSQLFLVTSSNESEIISLAQNFGQKAVLVSDEKGVTEVVATTKLSQRKCLGKLTQVTKDEANKAKFHIHFTEDGQEYYYVTKRSSL